MVNRTRGIPFTAERLILVVTLFWLCASGCAPFHAAGNYLMPSRAPECVHSLPSPAAFESPAGAGVGAAQHTPGMALVSASSRRRKTQNPDDSTLIWPLDGFTGADCKGRRGRGITIHAQEGAAVRSAGSGKVTYTGTMPLYGNVLIIEHPKRITTVYAHLKDIAVSKGERTEKGEVIGSVGSSGRVREPSLYFEVRSKSKPIDPRSVCRDDSPGPEKLISAE